MPHAIGPVGPPLRTLAPGLVEFEHAVGLRPAEVERDSSSRDDGPHPVVHLASRLVLVEAEVQPASQEVARLRHAARDAPGDAAAHRVRGTEVVLRRVFEERPDIAPRGEAGAEDVGVLGCIHDLVELVDVESAIEADFHGQGRQRQWCREGAATAELPVGAGDRHFTGEDRKSTRLNSSHGYISYAVFCLKKKTTRTQGRRSEPRRRWMAAVRQHLPPALHPVCPWVARCLWAVSALSLAGIMALAGMYGSR